MDIQVLIKIPLLEREIQVTPEEARKLYIQLDKMFGLQEFVFDPNYKPDLVPGKVYPR